MCRSIFVIVSLVVRVTIAQNDANSDAIAFPEMEENLTQLNKDNRQPVFMPAKCPENELYYPGDKKDDWICDCRAAHLYHPGTDMCWPAFQQGPCAEKQYLILLKDSVVPVCEVNPCNDNGFVLWNGKCEKLGTICNSNKLLRPSIIAVNATTLVVGCEQLRFNLRLGEEDTAVPACRPGGKRSVQNKCVPS